MNKFFEFHNYLDRFNNREYFKGTWEKLSMEAFRLLPFQYKRSSNSGLFTMFQDDTEITDAFFNGDTKITSWTRTGSGAFNSSGAVIISWTLVIGEYITSNNIALTSGDNVRFTLTPNMGGTITIQIKEGATTRKTVTGITEVTDVIFTASGTGNHTVVITATATGTIAASAGVLDDTLLSEYDGDDTYTSYDGSILYEMISNGSSSFSIYHGTEEFYSEDCDVGCVNQIGTWTGDNTDTNKSFPLTPGDQMSSGSFMVNKGDVVTAYLDSAVTNASDYDTVLIMSGYSDVVMSGTIKGDIVYYSGTALGSGSATVNVDNGSSGSYTVDNYDIEFGYSNKMLTLEVASTVDYGGIHYADGWTQKWYKRSNARRSTNPRITVIGQEPNGEIIKEKTITSTKYKANFKVTETEFDALLTSVGATVTITDQSGKVFTCENMEIDEPSWNYGNGMTEFSFLDNTSVHTLNNSVL